MILESNVRDILPGMFLRSGSRMIIFKRFFVALIFLILLLAGCAQSSNGDVEQPPPDITIDWVDFVKLGGIQYMRTDYSIDADKLGPQISEVKFKISDNVNNPDYIVKDGDAAYLEKGTPIYNINNYKSSFRIAIKATNEIIVYQVFDNPSAKKGSDIADISNKVDYIEINSKSNEEEIAAITDVDKINEMVDMVLKAPVDLSTSKQMGERYLISFHLKDGSEFKGTYWLESGQLSYVSTRFLLPVEFKIAVKEVLNNKSDDNS